MEILRYSLKILWSFYSKLNTHKRYLIKTLSVLVKITGTHGMGNDTKIYVQYYILNEANQMTFDSFFERDGHDRQR